VSRGFLRHRLAVAACALGLGAVAVQAQTVPITAAEGGNLWFVELRGSPRSEGASATEVQAEKASFRRAATAAGVSYRERRAYDTLFNGFAVEATAAERAKLARLPGVKALYPVELIQAPKAERALQGLETPQMNTALAMTGADIVQGMGYTGTGIKVGIIDTGIDIDHPNLGGNGTPGGTSFPSNRIPFGYDFVGDAYNADPTSPGYNPIPAPDAQSGRLRRPRHARGRHRRQPTAPSPGWPRT
jgi:minor extracellular serine protease Vpr